MERTPTDKRIDELADRQGRFEENVDRRFDRFERRVEAQFDRVDARFEQVDRRFEQFDRRFEQVVTKEEFAKAEEVHRERMDGLNARFDRWGKIVTGGTVTIVGAVIVKLLGI
jgi:hypothetical protein